MRGRFLGAVLPEPGLGTLALEPTSHRRRASGVQCLAEGPRRTCRVTRQGPEIADPLPQLGGHLRLERLVRANLLDLALCLGARFRPQLGGEQPLQPVVRAECRPAPAGERVQADEHRVAVLEQRLSGDQPTRDLGGPVELSAGLQQARQLVQHRDEVRVQLGARTFGPRLVAVLRQQPLAVDRKGTAVTRQVAGTPGLRDRRTNSSTSSRSPPRGSHTSSASDAIIGVPAAPSRARRA